MDFKIGIISFIYLSFNVANIEQPNSNGNEVGVFTDQRQIYRIPSASMPYSNQLPNTEPDSLPRLRP